MTNDLWENQAIADWVQIEWLTERDSIPLQCFVFWDIRDQEQRDLDNAVQNDGVVACMMQ